MTQESPRKAVPESSFGVSRIGRTNGFVAGDTLEYLDMAASTSQPTPAQKRRERAERNRQIVLAKDDGATWAEVASGFGISDRQARRAYLEHLREAGQVLDLDPGATLESVLRVHLDALETLRVLGESADNSSARVGAVRSRVAVAHDLLKLLTIAGVVPPADHAARIRLETEKRRFATAVVVALEERGIDLDELEADIDRAIRGSSSSAREVVAA